MSRRSKKPKSQRARKSSLIKPGRRPRVTRVQAPDIRWSPVVSYFIWQDEFLRVLAETGNVRHSEEVASVNVEVVFSAIENSREFAAKFTEARERALDVLTDVAMERLGL